MAMPAFPGASGSSREALAAAGAAGGDHLAAANRFHAGAKAVTALAHDLAGLKGPRHWGSLRFVTDGAGVAPATASASCTCSPRTDAANPGRGEAKGDAGGQPKSREGV